MTEQQKIAAIEALAEELLWTRETCTWKQAGSEMKEHFRRQTLKKLRVLNEDGYLNAKDVYEFLITGFWHNATEGQKLKCENAVQAMREILEEEMTEAI